MEKTEQIDVGTIEDPKVLMISVGLEPHIYEALVNLLKEYIDTFTWSYEDLLGLDPELVEHRLILHPDAKTVKQKLKRLHLQVAFQVKMKLTSSTKQSSLELLFILNGLPI